VRGAVCVTVPWVAVIVADTAEVTAVVVMVKVAVLAPARTVTLL